MSVSYKIFVLSKSEIPLMLCNSSCLPRIGEELLLPPMHDSKLLKVIKIIHPVTDILSNDFSIDQKPSVYAEEVPHE